MNYRFLPAVLLAVCAACTPTVTPSPVASASVPTITPIVLPQAATPHTTLAASLTPLPTATLTTTLAPSATPTLTATASATATATATASATATLTATATITLTPTLTPTTPPAITVQAADTIANVGWSCGDFPCFDRVEEWQRRISVPVGFELSHVGQFPGEVNQIAYDAQGALYATVLENGTQTGAVWRMNPDGNLTRRTPTLLSPFGLAFQPDTDSLYLTSRTTPTQGGSLWRLNADDSLTLVRDDLPCCYGDVGSQVNGLLFGADGALYIGVSAVTDHGEGSSPQVQAWANPLPLEAAIVRFDLLTGEFTTFAAGIRSPMDIAQDSSGQFYTTDSGLVSGIGDRLLQVTEGTGYGFPYYRGRGCEECPASRGNNFAPPDLLTLPTYTLPRGIVSYRGSQFPANFRDTLFVALWNAPYQQVIWLDPRAPALKAATADQPYTPSPFVTGLLRPSDVIVDAAGALIVADWLSGQVWRVRYTGEVTPPTPTGFGLPTRAATDGAAGFATNTPAP